MRSKIQNWFSLDGSHPLQGVDTHENRSGETRHGHTHGVIDPSIAESKEGIRAVKWSFAILMGTALLQFAAVTATGSVALLADTIHNFADATTAIPLGVAFLLGRRTPTRTFTYGLGRVEDLAGLLIVLIILFSAIASAYEAITRLTDPQPIHYLPLVAAAGVIGLIGNAAAAFVRIRVGHRINSTALIADGYHAAADSLTSLAVVAGAVGVHLGWPLADPVIGLLITLIILGIVWQSARAVVTRLLDGVEPGIVLEIEHAAEHVPSLKRIPEIKARWLGHELHAEITIALDGSLSLVEAMEVSTSLQREMLAHVPVLSVAHVRFVADS
jgi:cation diffusion facilitator family transporter